MQRNLVLFLGAVITWVIFGALIAVIGAVFVLGSTWNTWTIWGINTLLYGAAYGVLVGLTVGQLVLAAAITQRSRLIFAWVVGGSIIGGIIGFGTVIIVGGYPTRSQADLGLIEIAPIGVILGGFSGAFVGLNLWKSRRNLH